MCGVRLLHPAQHDLLDRHHGDRHIYIVYSGTLVVQLMQCLASFAASLLTNHDLNIQEDMFYSGGGANRGQILHVFIPGTF